MQLQMKLWAASVKQGQAQLPLKTARQSQRIATAFTACQDQLARALPQGAARVLNLNL
jgi:hypothetical protein